MFNIKNTLSRCLYLLPMKNVNGLHTGRNPVFPEKTRGKLGENQVEPERPHWLQSATTQISSSSNTRVLVGDPKTAARYEDVQPELNQINKIWSILMRI